MKRNLFLAISFFLISSVNAGNNDQLPNVPDSLIRSFEEKVVQWMDAYNSGNAKDLSPLYSENADYISSHVNGLVAKGRERLIQYFQDGINLGGHIDSIEILSINYSCDLAVLFCKYEATNSGQKAIGRNMLVLKLIDKEWLIVKHMTVV